MKTFKLFAVLMMAVMCVGVSSCSKDDDENGNSMLVGTWVEETTEDIMIFNADGSGESITIAEDRHVSKYTYTFDSKTMMLTLKWPNPIKDDDPETTIKIEINGNVMKIADEIYHKQ